MNMDSVISIPVNFAYIVPKDWSVWWKTWNQNAKFMKKTIRNQNTGQALWKGFDIYVKKNFDSSYYGYNAQNIDCAELFPCLFENLHQFPMEIEVMRAVSSLACVQPHHDMTMNHVSIRSLLFDNNPKDTFYYYYKSQKIYQRLPVNTNTWAYNDHVAKHGTDYYFGHSKILIMYWGTINKTMLNDSVKSFYDSAYVINL